MKCNKCGFENENNSEFCAKCGSVLPKKNKKLFIILGVIFCIIAIIVSYFVIRNLKNKFDDPFESIDELSKLEDNTDGFGDNYKEITCYSKEDLSSNGEYDTILQIKIFFDENDKVNDLYFKGTNRIPNYNPDDTKSRLAKKLIVFTVKYLSDEYKKQFINYKLMVDDKDDKITFVFKITDNYYEAINNNFSTIVESKNDILNAFKDQGYICNLK